MKFIPFIYPGEFNGAPLKIYEVVQSKVYRFRVIGHGTIFPFRISVDDHEISVVASDGYDVVPTPVESIIINPGERYDFLVTANKSVGNYWIRAHSIEVSFERIHKKHTKVLFSLFSNFEIRKIRTSI